MSCVSPTSYAYGLDTTAMHSSQVPAQTPRVQRNLVKDIVAQFNQEAKQRETLKLQRHHSYEPSDNGYSPSPPPPVIPLSNGGGQRHQAHPQRSKSEHNLIASPDGVVYAQVQVVNGGGGGSNKGDPSFSTTTNGKYKTTVHTVVPSTNSGHGVFGRHNNKLAKSTGSLHRVQVEEEEEEEDNRVLNCLNNKATNDNHSYYRFDDPANDSYKHAYNTASRNGHAQQSQVKTKRRSNSDDDDEEVFHRNVSSHIVPLRLSNGATDTSPPSFQTKNVEKWSEKEDLGPNRRKYTEHEKVHLVTVSGDSYGGRIKSPSPNLKSIKNDDYTAEEEEAARLRRHRDVTASPSGSNYSKKKTTLEDSTVQRSRTVTPEVVTPRRRSPSPKVEVSHYYFGQPAPTAAKSTTSRHHVSENVTINEDSHWRGGRRHSTDSGNGGVLLSSRLVKQADAELNPSPTFPPLMTSSWREDDVDGYQLRSLSPRLRPLSPSSGISSVPSAGGQMRGETREEKRHFRKQETTKTTKHETERSRVKPVGGHRSRSAERHQRHLEYPEEVTASRSASSSARHRRNRVGGSAYYHDEDRMETSGSELYGGSQGSHMSLGSANNSALNEKESIMAAHSNTPTSMLKQVNKNSISYENAQRQESNHAASNGSGGRRMWFERLNDDVDDVRLPSATMSRLEGKKNRRNHTSDNELSVNTVDRRDMRRRRNHHHADRSHAHKVDRSSSFNSRVDSYHSEVENESQASSTASKPKKVNFKGNGFLSPMHREALLRSVSPVRAPSIASNDSEASNRSVILHATAVADIPAPAQYRQRSANTSPAPSVNGSGDGRSSSLSRGGRQKESRTVQRSFSLLSPWKPKKYKEKSSSAASSVDSRRGSHTQHQQYEEQQQKESHKVHKKSQENLSHHSSSAERLDSLSPLPSEATPPKSKKKAGILHRRHSMPKDSRFANFFRRKNKDSKKK